MTAFVQVREMIMVFLSQVLERNFTVDVVLNLFNRGNLTKDQTLYSRQVQKSSQLSSLRKYLGWLDKSSKNPRALKSFTETQSMNHSPQQTRKSNEGQIVKLMAVRR